ncbi:uncharacterized protein BO88DRAFT_439071 [Aspergillus vadensis CBS 113365]|uniref:Uncharacterized protein n=1 Tax=Aspergillus vadensis (strain CBS 113365 / IMI 142717 / IBT 24658) TaxID=1448311 RepID=A0A319AUA9_ASPVC|nr:hypothetical protein BO88DRAFT_439071 [Aspergillus vadensis CBS 113365]PYH63839.1 hypothetical protein BO88DRAFT_439071 [Aspergillus vadensis CBS 113365]
MTTDTNIPTAGHLQVLLDPAVTSQDTVEPRIILVPGIGTIPPKNWPFANPTWLASLQAPVLRHAFSHHRQANLTGLSQLRWPYSQAGFINRYGSIVNAIAGVIFFSTPHRYGDRVTSLMRFRDILGATTGRKMKLSKSSVEQEGAILLDLADRFEEISFRSPILSIYELRQSKSRSIPLRRKYQQLVDRGACLTHAPMETVIGLNINHHDSCLFTKSAGNEGIPELEKFVHDTLHDAVLLVAFRLEDRILRSIENSCYQANGPVGVARCNDEQYSPTMSDP